ncbi:MULTISPECIES: hypothetical protein [Rhizobium/Agrobacterium group]|uniref:hypothetical protein n=1 Tax=Rhizobium/Agrobacterium group TaxID=227290 RepID=UPI00107F5D2B|nr:MULTISPECIES: hypothetical protein [Rhizobium/Agrobacterium group]MBB4402918.1 hypothetical protein [Agrobacterium radiobacter]MBB5589171.1 hypothetical protein [Agrobacterium radiobacter]
MEFAACRECNHGTKGADTVAALFSRLSQADEDMFWQSPEGITLRFTMERDAPGVREEVFGDSTGGPRWIRSRSGILKPKIVIQADGPLVKAYLDVFAAKIGMALYRQHVGAPLPIGGGVQTLWYLNAGLSEEHAHAHLSILPINGSLKQGKFTASEQFAYRYNCDEKSILAALVGLNSNLHLFVIATSQPETYGLPHQIPGSARAGNFVRPGELTGIIGRGTVGPREEVVSNHP